jgi:hypothetical protein
MKYIAEWNNEDGNPEYKLFDNERDALEFVWDAYADCLVSVSVRRYHSLVARPLPLTQ